MCIEYRVLREQVELVTLLPTATCTLQPFAVHASRFRCRHLHSYPLIPVDRRNLPIAWDLANVDGVDGSTVQESLDRCSIQ
jgi:hypothetical protein